jgi:hypothetical protein
MHKRGLISFSFAGRLRMYVPMIFRRRERAKSKLAMFREPMFVVCLLRPVKQIHAAFLDTFAVLAV